MTSIQACEETIELWTEMARFAREESRAVEKWEVPGPWVDYHHQCPCCESCAYLNRIHCAECPMWKEWSFYSKSSTAPCEDFNSPYRRQLNFIEAKGVLCIDVEFFCLLIVDMAEEALERLRKEQEKRSKVDLS